MVLQSSAKSTQVLPSNIRTVTLPVKGMANQPIRANTITNYQPIKTAPVATSKVSNTFSIVQNSSSPASIRPKGQQTIVLVGKDGQRQTLQLPSSAISVGKDGRSLITLPQKTLQVCVPTNNTNFFLLSSEDLVK